MCCNRNWSEDEKKKFERMRNYALRILKGKTVEDVMKIVEETKFNRALYDQLIEKIQHKKQGN